MKAVPSMLVATSTLRWNVDPFAPGGPGRKPKLASEKVRLARPVLHLEPTCEAG
jgi:hypothetical protein